LLTAEKSETPIDPPVTTPEIDDKPLDPGESGILVIKVSQLSIYLPYSLRSTQTQNISNPAPTGPVHLPPPDITHEIVASESIAPSLSTVASDETPADDNSEDSAVIVQDLGSTDEADAVRRRWFREEMRQSPVHFS
jgi:hypothetical protein